MIGRVFQVRFKQLMVILVIMAAPGFAEENIDPPAAAYRDDGIPNGSCHYVKDGLSRCMNYVGEQWESSASIACGYLGGIHLPNRCGDEDPSGALRVGCCAYCLGEEDETQECTYGSWDLASVLESACLASPKHGMNPVWTLH